MVLGSGELPQTLMGNLVDEYQLMVYPVVLGTGKRLFRDDGSRSLLRAGRQHDDGDRRAPSQVSASSVQKHET